MTSLIRKFFFSKQELKTIKSISINEQELSSNENSILLVDIPDTANEFSEQIALTKYFSTKYNLKPKYYYPSLHILSDNGIKLAVKSFIYSLSRGQRKAKEFGITEGLSHKSLSNREIKNLQSKISKQWQNIKSKEDLVALKIEEVAIGIAIYDTYLRLYSKATIDLNDKELYILFRIAFLSYYAIRKYFSKNNVKFVLLGHAVYIGWKILSDYAISKGIKVYVTYNSRFSPLHLVNENRGLQTVNHMGLKNDFLSLNENKQKLALKEGENFLRNRWSGVIDNTIGYMKESAFKKSNNKNRIIVNHNKKSVFIMLHSFLDSPHIYKDMVFPDFYEWCIQTFDFIKKEELFEKYDFFIKPHPNRIVGEDEIIENLVRRYSFIKTLKGVESNIHILETNPAAIITVYGTVTAEFTYKNIPVITSGDNPASSFNFSYQATNKEAYFSFLKNIDTLIVTEEMKNDAIRFVYMFFVKNPKTIFNIYPFKRFRRHLHSGKYINRVVDYSYDSFKKIIENSEK